MLRRNYFHPRTRHSQAFYLAVLLVLAEGVMNRAADHEIANLLTAKGLLAPSGKKWTATAVKAALFKLRHFREYPSRLHNALLQLLHDGFVKPGQVSVLFEPRPMSVM